MAHDLEPASAQRLHRIRRHRLHRGQFGDDRLESCRKRTLGPPLAVLAPGGLERVGATRRGGRSRQTRQHLLAPERVDVGLGEDRFEDHSHRRGAAQERSDVLEVGRHRRPEAGRSRLEDDGSDRDGFHLRVLAEEEGADAAERQGEQPDGEAANRAPGRLVKVELPRADVAGDGDGEPDLAARVL